MSLKTTILKAIKWRDKDALQNLVDAGYLIPISKEMRHAFHHPDDGCFKCNLELSLWWAVKEQFKNIRRKKK